MGVSQNFLATFLGVPIIRTIVFWGLVWGPPILGNYHIGLYKAHIGVSKIQGPQDRPQNRGLILIRTSTKRTPQFTEAAIWG